MNRFPNGHVVDGTYRVESLLSETDRASVYVVTHVRFPGAPLVLKVAALDRTDDFERDTTALSTLASPCVAKVTDRGTLPDGRLYRVMQRLAGPTLREALATDDFTDDRAMEILVELAAAVHEAQLNALGPCDLSVDNLMFADGRAGRLCLMRALRPNASNLPHSTNTSLELDQAALSSLRSVLEGPDTQVGAHEPGRVTWKPPSSVQELRAAMMRSGRPRTPMSSDPGATIERWEVQRQISETLQATVYDVRSASGVAGVLKVAGPGCDHVAFNKHSDLLARVQSRHVVRVLDFGKYEGTPYLVMDPLFISQSARLERGHPLPIDTAIQTVDELLWGAEAISKYNGSPCDFSLEHCYQAKAEPSPAVMTHAMVQLRAIGLDGRPSEGDQADAWSAAVALYELITGHLPFPTTKHSLAKAWMGMPTPIGTTRPDVPADITDLVHSILTGKRVTTADLRRELTRIRSTPARHRPSLVPERRSSVPPRASVAPQAVPRVSVIPSMPAPSPDLRTMADDNPPSAYRRSIEPPPPSAIVNPHGAVNVDGAWDLALAPSRCPLTNLATAAVSLDGDEIAVVSQDAVARFRNGQWTVDPARETAASIVGLFPMAEGGYLATTSTGALLRLGAAGGFVPWGVTLDRFCFNGAVLDGYVLTLVGGTRDTKRAAVAKLVGESVTIVAEGLDAPPLRAATYLPDGTLLAVSEGGVIVRVRGPMIAESIHPCTVDLLATSVVGEECVAVGAGAWAFRVTTGPLAAHLEAVDTTSALTCVSSSGSTAWAGSSRGRVLRRSGRHWRRMSRNFDGDPAVLAIHAMPAMIRAVLADGHVVIGRPVG